MTDIERGPGGVGHHPSLPERPLDPQRLLYRAMRATASLALVFVAAFVPRDAESAVPPQPNVLLLFSDDQRPDTIAALGNEHIRTPHLDALVKRGTTFSRAICANPICTPSRAELLTGASGFRNGTLDFGRAIEPDMVSWATTLKNAGYHTWYVGKWHVPGLPRQHGFERTNGLFMGGGGPWATDTTDWNGREVTGYRGWVFRDDDGRLHPERGVGLTPNISARFADAAIELIDSKPTKPFFLQVSFTAPHDPCLMPFGYEDRYDPKKLPLPKNFLPRHPFDHGNFDGRDEKLFEWPRTPEMVRDELAVYYAVISHMDAQIGRILAALARSGQAENTIVIFSSDHGLSIGSHGLRGKQSMYEHTINVPLVIAGPGLPEGRRTAAQCYLRDLYPTVCDLAGVPIPESVEGKSLRPVLMGEVKEVYDAVFGYFRDSQRMIRRNRWKLIHYPKLGKYQLFDLEADPWEMTNAIDDAKHRETAARLKDELRRWQESVRDPVLASGR